MSSKKTKTLMLAALSINLIMHGADAAQTGGTARYSGAVMNAYQQAYAMNFEIWRPSDLPAGWYATFDGFPVAQIAENRWVYGQIGIDGVISPTNILVGSVVPANVPGLARISSVWTFGKGINSPEFQKIREYRINRMGWLNDNGISTIIAWHTSRPEVYVWLGNRWKRLEPRIGEYTWQMLKRLNPWIANELRKNDVWYQSGEPLEAADMARQCGYIWSGKVIVDTLKNYKGSTSSESTRNVTSLRDTSTGNSGNSTSEAPVEITKNGNSNWDVD